MTIGIHRAWHQKLQAVAWTPRDVRSDHGSTRTTLARKLDVSQPAVARLETGDHEPTVAALTRLAHKLRIALRLDVAPESVVLGPAS